MFLGVERSSNELRVGDAEWVFNVRVGDVRRRPESSGRGWDKLASVTGVPWKPMTVRGAEGGADVPEEPPADVDIRVLDVDEGEGAIPEFAPDAAVAARRLQITEQDVKKHGPTAGCRKCSDVRQGKKHVRAHSEECRQRFVKLFEQDDQGRKRLDAYERKMNDSVMRVTVADMRRVQQEMDGGTEEDRMHRDDMHARVGQPQAFGPADAPRDLRPERVVTSADDKAEYDKRIRETMRYMRTGKQMQGHDASASASSSAAAPQGDGTIDDGQGDGSGDRGRGMQRGVEDDGSDRPPRVVDD